MSFHLDFFWSDKNNKKINWGLFPLFLIICLLLGVLLIYFIFPAYFSEEKIERIPIIIDNGRDKVLSHPVYHMWDITRCASAGVNLAC